MVLRYIHVSCACWSELLNVIFKIFAVHLYSCTKILEVIEILEIHETFFSVNVF